MVTLRRGKHREADIPEVSNIRVLKRDDLAVLMIPRPKTTIANLRDTHHSVARAIAAGLSNAEVAQVTGFSIGRVNTLRADPAFRDLIAHKRAMIDAEFVETADPVISYLKQNALKAAAMLSDKLDAASEADEFLPTRDLLGIAELGFDRTGYGKVNKNVNVNVDLAAGLERMRKARDQARQLRTIEASPHEPRSAPGASASPPALERRVPSQFRRL